MLRNHIWLKPLFTQDTFRLSKIALLNMRNILDEEPSVNLSEYFVGDIAS